MSQEKQITRDNHYVPQWYQKGFHAKGKHKLFVLNLEPSTTILQNGAVLHERQVEELGPKLAFKELDLYTTRFGEILNDDIETYLFGRIDKRGADAVRAWISRDLTKIHRTFQDFFEYIDAQKLRTPKGLDMVLAHFQGLPQVELMEQMQLLRQMHCTMWSEGVREIVSASKAHVKFLVSDHPVTIYNPKLPPDSPLCQYPNDPSIDLIGSQTIFPLDADHCLIISNLEYVKADEKTNLLSSRTNARFRGGSLVRTDALITGRQLNDDEVHAVNLVVKARAKKYVASSDESWLYPERHCSLQWDALAKVFLPQDGLWGFGGETFIRYEDGTTHYQDQFGRTSRSHEILAKAPLAHEPRANAPCGCGSGVIFKDCCADLLPQHRASWSVLSIRERNLTLLRGINDILNLNNEKTSWLDVRKALTSDQVRKIHELYALLWPVDTQLSELLPRPQLKRLRALYLGVVDARTLSVSTGMLAYVDELVLCHPFINANGVRPEFSPVAHPEKFHEQTLRSVFVLKVLEPALRSGKVHLVTAPLRWPNAFSNCWRGA